MSRISLHDEWPAIPGAGVRHASTGIMSVLAPCDVGGGPVNTTEMMPVEPQKPSI